VVAGDVVKAHRAGVEIARPIYTMELEERPDIVVASSHPADRDLWQGFKPVNNCGMVVKDGGTLILLIPAPEGIAPDHTQLVDFGTASATGVLALVEQGKVADEVAAATYLAFERTRRRVNIVLVSDGVSCTEAAKIGISATTSFPEALSAAFERHGRSARVGVVTQGADIMRGRCEGSRSSGGIRVGVESGVKECPTLTNTTHHSESLGGGSPCARKRRTRQH